MSQLIYATPDNETNMWRVKNRLAGVSQHLRCGTLVGRSGGRLQFFWTGLDSRKGKWFSVDSTVPSSALKMDAAGIYKNVKVNRQK